MSPALVKGLQDVRMFDFTYTTSPLFFSSSLKAVLRLWECRGRALSPERSGRLLCWDAVGWGVTGCPFL